MEEIYRIGKVVLTFNINHLSNRKAINYILKNSMISVARRRHPKQATLLKPRVHSHRQCIQEHTDLVLGHAEMSQQIASELAIKEEIKVDTYTTSSCDPPCYV